MIENYSTPVKKSVTRKHVVKSGETLSSISRKRGTTVQQLMKRNKLKTTTIHPG
ncbi:MAG: LysM peptidoglycan-binding domain-containing protein [Bacteroidetes bacterium]|nr:LysM peptidoglycan-binding domain-containing protein [Bacteroidota bacterium]